MGARAPPVSTQPAQKRVRPCAAEPQVCSPRQPYTGGQPARQLAPGTPSPSAAGPAAARPPPATRSHPSRRSSRDASTGSPAAHLKPGGCLAHACRSARTLVRPVTGLFARSQRFTADKPLPVTEGQREHASAAARWCLIDIRLLQRQHHVLIAPQHPSPEALALSPGSSATPAAAPSRRAARAPAAHLKLLEAKRAHHLLHQRQHAHDLARDLLRQAEDVRVILRKAPHAEQACAAAPARMRQIPKAGQCWPRDCPSCPPCASLGDTRSGKACTMTLQHTMH